MTKNRTLFTLLVVGLVAAAVAIAWLFHRAHTRDVGGGAVEASTLGPVVASNATSPATSSEDAVLVPAETETAGETRSQMDPELAGMFVADEQGRLVLNETARLNLEKLQALNTPEDFLAKIRSFSAVLPPQAHAEVLRLAASYLEYVDALHTTFPPENEVDTVGEAEAELAGIRELRVKHFGPEAAQALFGEEDRMNQRMIELMALEADDSIPLTEKAHRAQQLLLQPDDAAQAPSVPTAPPAK